MTEYNYEWYAGGMGAWEWICGWICALVRGTKRANNWTISHRVTVGG